MPAKGQSNVDWEAVEREYRAGQLSLREIGRLFKVTDTAIRKRAKAENWQRDLTDKVREAVRNKLVRDGSQSQRANDEEIVEAAADRSHNVVLSHRTDISQLRALSTILATRLSQHLDGISGEGPGIGDKESATDMLEKLTRIRARLIPLERQAFNIDNGSDPNAPTSVVDTPIGAAQRKAALALILARQ